VGLDGRRGRTLIRCRSFERSLSHLAGHINSLGGAQPIYKPYVPASFEDQARVLLDARVPVFSFICGVPSKEILDECRRQAIIAIGTATTRTKPSLLIRRSRCHRRIGVRSGRPSRIFPSLGEESLTGTFSLSPQVADAVSAPVVAAGGIADARGIIAAFALGAEGVQLGTAFLASDESGASALHRNALLSGKARRTALTRGFTGRLARGIHNQLLEDLNRPGVEILPYPLQRALVRNVSVLAEQAANPELLPLWAGQSASLSQETDAIALLQKLVSDVTALRVRFWSGL